MHSVIAKYVESMKCLWELRWQMYATLLWQNNEPWNFSHCPMIHVVPEEVSWLRVRLLYYMKYAHPVIIAIFPTSNFPGWIIPTWFIAWSVRLLCLVPDIQAVTHLARMTTLQRHRYYSSWWMQLYVTLFNPDRSTSQSAVLYIQADKNRLCAFHS